MDFSRLKELVKRLGGVLVLNGDEPEFVILSYRQYEKIEAGEEVRLSTGSKTHNGSAETNGLAKAVVDRDISDDDDNDEDERGFVERLNHEILALKEEIRLKEEAELVANEQSAEPVAQIVDFD